MKDKIFEYCKKAYIDTFNSEFEEYRKSHGGAKKILEEAERIAQKQAIKEALSKGVGNFPSEDVVTIWKNIYKVHIFRKSGLSSDEETIAKVISADQSWKKSSGHAFEGLVKEIANLSLTGTNIQVVLQKDLSLLLKAGELANEPRDIAWLEKMISGSIFDLYAIFDIEEKIYCYGCIQCKTSIRDRVTRDREPSIHAMQSFFWSVCIALDGEFLKLPKYNCMINGGSDEFPENGWHGMYVLSEIDEDNRLYHSNFDLDIFTKHAIEAAEYWKTQRQWFNQEWKAK